MSNTGHKKNRLRIHGFTIVELLIAMVIISILVTITSFSYSGMRNKSRSQTAKTNAASVKKAAEAYFNTANVYPSARSHFSSSFVNMPTDINLLTSGSLTASNGENSILYRYVNTSGAYGACIMYWDYYPSSGSPGVVVYARLGNATSGNCNATTGSFPS